MCWRFPLGATEFSLSELFPGCTQQGWGGAQFQEWGCILLIQQRSHTIFCKTEALQALLLYANLQQRLAGSCRGSIRHSLSRLHAQRPCTNLTDLACRIDLILSPQGTHGTEAEVLLSVVTPAPGLHSPMLCTGGPVFSSEINPWVETHQRLWELVKFHRCQVLYHAQNLTWLIGKE